MESNPTPPTNLIWNLNRLWCSRRFWTKCPPNENTNQGREDQKEPWNLELLGFLFRWRKRQGHGVYDSFQLNILERRWRRELDLTIQLPDVNSQNESIRVPPTEVQKLPVLVVPTNRQAL